MSARELRTKMHGVTSALQLFTCIFFFVVVKPIQSKQVEVNLASYLCLHHTRLYYFSKHCTHENSIMVFITTLQGLTTSCPLGISPLRSPNTPVMAVIRSSTAASSRKEHNIYIYYTRAHSEPNLRAQKLRIPRV